jgi:hypothetical protein
MQGKTIMHGESVAVVIEFAKHAYLPNDEHALTTMMCAELLLIEYQ